MNFLTSDNRQVHWAIPAQTSSLGRSVWVHEDKEFKNKNPVVYQNIARQLNEKRIFRECHIDNYSNEYPQSCQMPDLKPV